jgi:hypothetical protein
VLRLESCEEPKQFTIAERRAVVAEFWRHYQVTEGARVLAEEIRKKAEAAGPDVDKMVAAMRQAASEAGLTSATLRRIGRTTEAPKAPEPEAGKELSPEVAALARRITLANRVRSDYPLLSSLAVGKLREPVLADEKVEAAFAVLVTEKYEPKPVEMSDEDLRQERMAAASRVYSKAAAVFGFDEVAKRMNLQRFEEKPNKAANIK